MQEQFVSAANEIAVDIETFAGHFAQSNHRNLDRNDAREGLARLTAAMVALEDVRQRLQERLDRVE